jgi:hypothetical protein
MRKIILFGLLLAACSKLEFKYDSNVNYSIYKKAYVLEIFNQVPSMSYSEVDMMRLFCDDLINKSGFTIVYNHFDNSQNVDSSFLTLRLTVIEGEYKYKEIDHDNGDVSYYYEATVTVECDAFNNNIKVYQVEKSGEYNQEYDSDSDYNFDEVKNTALTRALAEIAKYYTKSYVI